MSKLVIYTFAALIIIFFTTSNILSQESENKPTIEEIKGQVDGIDENVIGLLTDVSGLKKLKVSGYLQFQWEKTEKSTGFGSSPYDASDYIQSRFRIRRSRIKVNYNAGLSEVVIQGDYSNEKFTLKDAYLSFTDPWLQYFKFTGGVFNRPNYEVEYSSSQRESMERSTVIRTLYPDERDLGFMFTVEPEELFKLQLAGFNNTYLGELKQFFGNSNNDPMYYMIRLTKEFAFQDLGLGLDIGAHARLGNLAANTNKVIESENNSSVIDSTSIKKGDKIGRNWFGFEAQLYWDFLGGMKLMGEYIMGSTTDEMSASSVQTPSPIRKRDFSGFYAMLVKNIGTDFQFVAKYDSYNPNTKISEDNIKSKSDLTTNTFGIGLHNYTFPNVRISLWYDMIMTKTHSTVLPNDPVDNLLTLRFQYKY